MSDRSNRGPQRHLDLGCGTCPRNPYDRRHLCGTDIRPWDSATALPAPDFDYRMANLVLDPIPWPDNSFESVSAFDFLEHVPRLLMTPDGTGTRFPFVELMDEVWRVLAPGGLLYAVTPAYPSPEAFQDPTHVNIITERTHEYFCGPQALGRMYGFSGHFRAVRVLRPASIRPTTLPRPGCPCHAVSHTASGMWCGACEAAARRSPAGCFGSWKP